MKGELRLPRDLAPDTRYLENMTKAFRMSGNIILACRINNAEVHFEASCQQ